MPGLACHFTTAALVLFVTSAFAQPSTARNPVDLSTQ
jgi:hypothetical protein